MPETPLTLRIQGGRAVLGGVPWSILQSGEPGDSAPALLPLQRALARREGIEPGRGVWLAPGDDPLLAAPLLGRVAAIGVQFPKFADGRGFSIAFLLRSRLQWRGELHAFGDILPDQLLALRRVGFDSFALAPGRNPASALRALEAFSVHYQGSAEPGLPHFAGPAAIAQGAA